MRIVFLGTHGQYNIGDELLLETFLTQLGSQHSFIVNSYDPKFTEQMLRPRFKIEALHTTREIPRLIKNLLTSDLVFFGGGSIIKELYASVGRNRYSTLFMILGVVTFAKLIARRQVMMSNIGVGPLTTKTGERMAKWILNQVDLLAVRDEKSLETCLRIGISPSRVRLVPDAVFINTPEMLLSGQPCLPASKRMRVALNLNYDIENRNAWEGFLTSLALGLKRWNEIQPLEIHTLPMQSKFKDNDDQTVLKNFRERIADLPVVLHEPQTAQEAAQIIAGCDVVLAERLHALVISSILGKPFLGLVYDVKVQKLVEYLGMANYAIDINQPFSAELLLERLTSLAANRSDVQDALTIRSTQLRDELGKFFVDLRSNFPTASHQVVGQHSRS
jgi:polysaccharide pyruvyl transferase CsaB